ncbi:hypothetical protein DY000_02014887 [Brassica cretica]|uniref:Uncharacterized protein n=1 Tax=Brassica cretica TaxID=69181 RepID=A0ABQ7D8W8_BRACR|nr:hypothetical protein DY000_02014887 [Brassica cretica]
MILLSCVEHSGLAIISRPLSIIAAALTVLSLAFLRNVVYDIVSLLLLVLVKLSSVQENFRHIDIFGRLLNLLTSLLLLVLVKLSNRNKMGDSVFGWIRLDKEDDTHVSTKEKSRYIYDGMLDTETMTNPTDRTMVHLLKHPKETKENCEGLGCCVREELEVFRIVANISRHV